jgi:hypothetical protein
VNLIRDERHGVIELTDRLDGHQRSIVARNVLIKILPSKKHVKRASSAVELPCKFERRFEFC